MTLRGGVQIICLSSSHWGLQAPSSHDCLRVAGSGHDLRTRSGSQSWPRPWGRRLRRPGPERGPPEHTRWRPQPISGKGRRGRSPLSPTAACPGRGLSFLLCRCGAHITVPPPRECRPSTRPVLSVELSMKTVLSRVAQWETSSPSICSAWGVVGNTTDQRLPSGHLPSA